MSGVMDFAAPTKPLEQSAGPKPSPTKLAACMCRELETSPRAAHQAPIGGPARRPDAQRYGGLARDLDAPLAKLRRAPGDVLEPVERESTWLRDKAFRRIWHATSMYKTDAMQQTPRKVLAARAREGN